ncbi:hypothetical protein DBR41_25515, partial [Pseudomonas sp. HMWF010]
MGSLPRPAGRRRDQPPFDRPPPGERSVTRALVCGVSGQDGAYLSKLLVDKGYEVVGVSRDAEMSRFEHLARLGVRDRMTFRSMTLN